MSIITLTSDFGIKNYNVANLKGNLLSISEGLNIVDISHEIDNYDIEEAAYMLSNSYRSFPVGTINIVLVNIYYSKNPRIILAYNSGYYFIVPDNGILSLIIEDDENTSLRAFDYNTSIAQLYEVIDKIIDGLMNGIEIDSLGEKVVGINNKISIKPVVSNNIIRASVIHIDNFGNAIVNIKKEFFYSKNIDGNFKLYYNPKDYISKISNNYTDVSIGDELCFFNSAGYMEIAVNMGNASEMLGLTKDSAIQIFF
ncbi:MAG: SAM-dependent chlorinase/fluorinase [Saprospiraceae bacterium]